MTRRARAGAAGGMLWGDMSEHTQSTRSSGAGKPLMWLALLLGLALLGFVTASAVRNNPIYSDRAANGISKYRFIEECRELATDSEKLTVSLGGQSLTLKDLVNQGSPLKPGDRVTSTLEAEPKAIVKSTETVDGGGWNLTAPVTVAVTSGGKTRTLGQLPMQCAHPRSGGKTTASLQVPGQ